MNDPIESSLKQLLNERSSVLNNGVSGKYKAVVVDTNDPLQMYRVRYLVPELHDDGQPVDYYPWAVPSFVCGNKKAGDWASVNVGDVIWVSFEKNHPINAIWEGAATPTMAKQYVLWGRSGNTPVPAENDGKQVVNDVINSYMPKDGRPMTRGISDRYGSSDIMSSTGFVPIEHQQTSDKINSPDSKFLAKISKYGHITQSSDIGYLWQNDFTGDFYKDENYEVSRYKYLVRLLHEDSNSSKDQRKFMHLTRYGSKFEMRDVGYNKNRPGEYSQTESNIGYGSDQRWIKTRTKGGHLIQLSDVGYSENDEFVQRTLLDEISDAYLDGEDGFNGDARFIRIVARSNFKMAIDDRGSSRTNAQNLANANSSIGNGFLLKGRASPGSGTAYETASGTPNGYHFEMNERNNSSTWISPFGSFIEITDDIKAVIIGSYIPDIPSKNTGVGGIEYLQNPPHKNNKYKSSNHLYIDPDKIELKTRGGSGKNFDGTVTQNSDLPHGFATLNGQWSDFNDPENRGLYLSKKDKIVALRSSNNKSIYIWFNEETNELVVFNSEQNSATTIYAAGDVNIKGKKINIIADDSVNVQTPAFNIQTATNKYSFGSEFNTDAMIMAQTVMAFFPQVNNGDGGPPGAPSGNPNFTIPEINIPEVPTIKP